MRERCLVQTDPGGKGVRGDRIRRKHLANHMGPEGLGVHGHGLISLHVPRVAITPSALCGRCDNYADTGEIYTHVVAEHVRRQYRRAHPRA